MVVDLDLIQFSGHCLLRSTSSGWSQVAPALKPVPVQRRPFSFVLNMDINDVQVEEGLTGHGNTLINGAVEQFEEAAPYYVIIPRLFLLLRRSFRVLAC